MPNFSFLQRSQIVVFILEEKYCYAFISFLVHRIDIKGNFILRILYRVKYTLFQIFRNPIKRKLR